MPETADGLISVHTDRHGDRWEFDGAYLTRIEAPRVRLALDEAYRAYGPFEPSCIEPPRCANCGAVFKLAYPRRAARAIGDVEVEPDGGERRG